MLELYFNYCRAIARFRRGTLGNEIDRIAASLSRVGYKRLSAKLYLARIAHFSAYATGCGCSKSVAISSQIVDRYLKAGPSVGLAQRHSIADHPHSTATRRHSHSTRWRSSSASQSGHPAGRTATPDQGSRRSAWPPEHRYYLDLRQGRRATARRCRAALSQRCPMSAFVRRVAASIDNYLALQHSLGYQFRKQAGSLHVFLRYVRSTRALAPLTQALAMECVMASNLTPNGRAIRYAVIRRFAEYHAAFDPRTERLDRQALPRSRAIPPPRILSDEALRSLMAESERVSTAQPLRGRTLGTVIGLLASTGLRSGEAVRLDRNDVDLTRGVLRIRNTKFRKDRLVPVHATTLSALQEYSRHRDLAFQTHETPAFFISSRGIRLSKSGLRYGFQQACALAKVNEHAKKALRPHDLRHRFAVTRLAEWHRQKLDVQSMLPLLATYLGHARYSDTAYYITATSELLGLAAASAFDNGGAA